MSRLRDHAGSSVPAASKVALAATLVLTTVLCAPDGATAVRSTSAERSSGAFLLAPEVAAPVTGRWHIQEDIGLRSLDAKGRALLVWDNLSIEADDLAYLSVSVEGLPTHLDAKIVWRTNVRTDPGVLVLPRNLRNRITVPLDVRDGWRGTISLVGIVVEDAFGIPWTAKSTTRITFGSPRLEPPSVTAAARAQLTAWVSPRLYDGSSINTAGPAGTRGTVPLLYLAYAFASVAILVGCLVALRKRRGSQKALSIAAAALLGAHVIASIPLWRDLAANAVEAWQTHAGRADSLNAVPEGYLYELAKRVKDSIEDGNARLFIASERQFTRQRMNYFLAPMNSAPVFESTYRLTRNNPPAASGDYVLVFNDVEIEWEAADHALSTPWHSYTANRLWEDAHASLFRITGVIR